MTAGNLIVFGIIALIAGLIVLVAATANAKPNDRRGTAPGRGKTKKRITVNAVQIGGAAPGTASTVTIRHTKDPQEHAKAMMPAKARRDDKAP